LDSKNPVFCQEFSQNRKERPFLQGLSFITLALDVFLNRTLLSYPWIVKNLYF